MESLCPATKSLFPAWFVFLYDQILQAWTPCAVFRLFTARTSGKGESQSCAECQFMIRKGRKYTIFKNEHRTCKRTMEKILPFASNLHHGIDCDLWSCRLGWCVATGDPSCHAIGSVTTWDSVVQGGERLWYHRGSPKPPRHEMIWGSPHVESRYCKVLDQVNAEWVFGTTVVHASWTIW